MSLDHRNSNRRRTLQSDEYFAGSRRTGIFIIGGLIASMAWPVLSGCEVLSQPCTPSIEPGVSVLLSDEQGAPIEGAVLTLTSGTFTETVRESSNGRYTGAEERPGTYDLSITADGFAPLTVDGIDAAAAPCHVVTANLALSLSAAGNGS